MTGKKKRRQNIIKNILTNEKYKDDALLRKSNTVDFVNRKYAVYLGEVPQYYAKDSHKASIEPAIFDWEQDMVKEREDMKKNCGKTIFSSRIKCGCCGEMYGHISFSLICK